MIISMPFRGRFLHVMQVSRKCLTTKNSDLATQCQELKVEVQFLGEHLFRANWQQSQFHKMRNCTPFPKATVMMVMDFAENYTCQYQGRGASCPLAPRAGNRPPNSYLPQVWFVCFVHIENCQEGTFSMWEKENLKL